MTTNIHPTAVVEKGAQLGEGCTIGAFAYIGPEVTLGDLCTVGPHCVLHSKVTMGSGNTLVSHAAIGGPPQDISFKGEASEIIVGDDNVFREFVTVNRATTKEERITRLGSRGLYMAYAHIAHDCHVGDNVIFANNATLAGHVRVGKHSTVGALSAIHQFCAVGDYAFIGGGSIITRDVLPFVKTVGARGEGHTYGINTIGLQRKGFSSESIEALKSAYRTLFHSKLLFTEAVAAVDRELGQVPEVAYLVKFIRESKRGIQR
jgi:UDP-N-acetylglucosamine acyltransferase